MNKEIIKEIKEMDLEVVRNKDLNNYSEEKLILIKSYAEQILNMQKILKSNGSGGKMIMIYTVNKEGLRENVQMVEGDMQLKNKILEFEKIIGVL